MNIGIASDHAGYLLKEEILLWRQTSFLFEDLGTNSTKAVDYPEFANKITSLINKNFDLGILICGTGIGMSICANRRSFVRAALCYDTLTACLARQHNDANILVLGANFTSKEQAEVIISQFCHQKFMGGRHALRIKSIL